MTNELFLITLTILKFELVRRYVTPTVAQKLKVPPETVPQFISFSGSFLHASISSALALTVLYATPEVFVDFTKNSVLMERACCFTIGYFAYDLYDMLLNHPNSQITFDGGVDNLGMTVHHLLAIIGLGYVLATKHHMGLFYSAIFIEVNSTFMHLKQLMKFAGCKRSNLMDYTTLITHLIFRQVLALYFAYALYHAANIGPFIYFVLVAFTIIEAGNLMLLRELIRDIRQPNKID